MLIELPDVLSQDEVAQARAIIDAAEWVDGNVTSGVQSALAKRNMQLPEESDAARAAGDLIQRALERNPLFFAAALPLKIFPPLFNRYGDGQSFAAHVDNAIRLKRELRVRTDLSMTVFLSSPDDYDGGELVIEDMYGAHAVKLQAGAAILYPASSIHHVKPVTRGARISSFFWIQSMVRSPAQRELLLQLDAGVQALAQELGHKHAQVINLTGAYHNLLRMWAEV